MTPRQWDWLRDFSIRLLMFGFFAVAALMLRQPGHEPLVALPLPARIVAAVFLAVLLSALSATFKDWRRQRLARRLPTN
ncbi:MAG TPA: hypothetical protein VGM20_06350 [Gemmatimonadales bacterium]|jgi:hypothetical protein